MIIYPDSLREMPSIVIAYFDSVQGWKPFKGKDPSFLTSLNNNFRNFYEISQH